MKHLLLLPLFCFFETVFSQSLPSCESKIYCQGKLLDKIQMARLFNDSKTFVDMSLKNPEDTVLENFDKLLEESDNNPSKDDLQKFVDDNFENFELEEWSPEDYNENPQFLEQIKDESVRQFAQDLVKLWPKFGRKMKPEVKENPDQYSVIPVTNGFIVPGGRFNEFYYWDTYWIIKGLLLCEMQDTVKGILENFFEIVQNYGFVPNGARVYYLNRSQPPLLTLMTASYMKVSDDTQWLGQNIDTLETELNFWMKNRTIQVELDGSTYNLFRYDSESGSPRPESYYEDVQSASTLENEDQKVQLWADLKSAAESGWDFSSRWMVNQNGGNEGNLTDAHTRDIIPVDLNSFLCQAFSIMSNFYKTLDNDEKANFWSEQTQTLKTAIKEVFYDEDDGVWYDYDSKLSQKRKYFYPSNLTPLWARANHQIDPKKIIKYLEQVLDYEGGIPASLIKSGQQWDFPGAWPPLQEIVINSLYRTGDDEANNLAKELAQKWIKSNMEAYNEYGAMFEKYDAEQAGKPGGGGEYEVQEGFGWTNGVALMLVKWV
ncbi:trehalase-like [Tribolium madens]|uniref:trehalase-like n=1 Tax=Tribolium madens TaxID=41895 RepID=UPI001CF72C8E|nr:trehalase-like [Tribolium madens]